MLTLKNRLWREQVSKLITLQQQLSDKVLTTANASRTTGLTIQLLLVGISLLSGSLIAWKITRSIQAPIGRAVVVAERIARGDLTSQIEIRIPDETGRLLAAIQSMQERLRTLVGNISESAQLIESASAEMATSNHDLSERTEQAAGNLRETAGSMKLLTEAVVGSADSSQQANALAHKAAQVAERGGSVVSQVVSTMEDINHSSRKIADILSVIDSIAFQTNILALNAAVEAGARRRARQEGLRSWPAKFVRWRDVRQKPQKKIKQLIGNSVEKSG